MDPGHVFRRQSGSDTAIQLKMEINSEQPLLYGEVIANGVPLQLLRAQNELTEKGAYRSQLNYEFVPIARVGSLSASGVVARWSSSLRALSALVRRSGSTASDHRKLRERISDRAHAPRNRAQQWCAQRGSDARVSLGLEFYQALPETRRNLTNARASTSKAELDAWLDNMIIDHRFTASEVREATGLELAQAVTEVRQRALQTRDPVSRVRILPYPGGRHPRRGFLDGAIQPQRETKISIFAPWKDGGYVVVDVPEAVFSNLGLTYLAHTHIPTIWDKLEQPLPKLEWSKTADGYSVVRKLPNGIQIASYVTGRDDGADMRIELTNGTPAKLTGLRVQVCTMLKGAVGFNGQQPLESIVDGPSIAIRGLDLAISPSIVG